VFAGKPIIGIAGGIGSGKSFVAQLFKEEGCLVLSADEQVRSLYTDPEIKQTMRAWWGDRVFNSRGEVNRRAVAVVIFYQPQEKKRLENLIHPRVGKLRQAAMAAAENDAQVLAFVWDIPLLFEVGLSDQTDAIVFVEAPWEERVTRVKNDRNWSETDLLAREKLQHPLDIKRGMSNYMLQNTADVGFARKQVREVLSKILARSAMGTPDKADSPG
jgi:dephospho-CoA kinase